MITMIPRSKLEPHPDNPRQDLGDLSELAASIKKSGLLQNLTVVPSPGFPDKYRIIIGHRRFAASEIAGLDELPCTIEEMDAATQVATMLAENMQRNDLTISDQVNGIQVMMNLGEDVKAISDKTGLSATTVRRRAKLADLDQEKLQKAEKRGATLMDLVEITKIEDASLRESVLDAAGTANFNDRLMRAKEQQKAVKELEKARMLLEPWAKLVRRDEWNKDNRPSEYVRSITLGSQTADYTKPTNHPEDSEYVCVYTVSSSYMTVYRIIGEAPIDNEAQKREIEQKNQQARMAACKEVCENTYRLREDFMRNEFRGSRDQTEAVMNIARFCIILTRGTHMTDDDLKRYESLIAAKSTTNPVLELGTAAFCLLDGGFQKQSYSTWNGLHNANDKLDAVYQFLTEIGYQMSDDEIAWQNGTHPCFTCSIIEKDGE